MRELMSHVYLEAGDPVVYRGDADYKFAYYDKDGFCVIYKEEIDKVKITVQTDSVYVEIKTFEVESQIIETDIEYHMFEMLLHLAKEAGYKHVRDNWGVKAYDTYTIDEAIEKFCGKNKPVDDELPF